MQTTITNTTIIAHGNVSTKFSEYKPYIPEIIALISDDQHLLVKKDGSISCATEQEYEQLLENKFLEVAWLPGFYVKDYWFSIEYDGYRHFEIKNETKFRLDRAKELIDSLNNRSILSSNPYNIIKAAATLVGMDVLKFIQFIESNRLSPNESLDGIYVRIKK